MSREHLDRLDRRRPRARRTGRPVGRLAAGLVASGTAVAGLMTAAPAQAAPIAAPIAAPPARTVTVGAASTTACFTPTNVASVRSKTKYHPVHDHDSFSAAELRAVQNDMNDRVKDANATLAQKKAKTASAAHANVAPHRTVASVVASLPKTITIPVYVHIIRGKHKSDRKMYRSGAVRAIKILNTAYSGGEHTGAANTRWRFRLVKVSYTRNDRWFHAKPDSKADKREKRHLHRGGSRTLNVYFTGGGHTSQGELLGWSHFPWQYHVHPKLDGVTVNVNAMPGGKFTHYNLGKTLVHETGHWLGLLHTFQGGCSSPGDMVADTPAEAYPTTGCPPDSGPNVKDTCSAPGTDPIHNFMDYAYDSCMWEFTPGQSGRMDRAWVAWRRPKS